MINYYVDNIESYFESKVIIITGAGGTIGKNITKTLLAYNPKSIRLLDNDDTIITELKDELEVLDNKLILRYFIGDIRDRNRMIRALEGVDYVFHCAALKHVAIGEYNPGEIILTNINGTENVIEASLQNNVERVIYTSSDKAVNPVNTMGATKLLGEKLIIAANYIRGSKRTIFSSVRFGNVMGSRGSIIPRFKKRIKQGLPLVVTDPDITRFMMPIKDAVDLTIKALVISNGGEIFVLKMLSLKLGDLVDLFIEYAENKYGQKIKSDVLGLFPGEKLFEELMTEDELARVIELDDMYVILPYIKELLQQYPKEYPKEIQKLLGKIQDKNYNSHLTSQLSKEELKNVLNSYDVFTD